MALVRSEIAADPRGFGRKFPELSQPQPRGRSSSLRDDLRLFAVTFVAGFLFVSIILA